MLVASAGGGKEILRGAIGNGLISEVGQMSANLNILLCLPTTSQIMKSATAVAVANTCTRLSQLGHEVDLHNIDSAEIVTARDMFANMVLHSDRWDHLLFIDSDMNFDPSLVIRMIDRRAEICGAAYVRRTLDLSRLIEVSRDSQPLNVALARASDFTFKPAWEDGDVELMLENGFCRAAAVGMGCVLISRSALLSMVDAAILSIRKDLSAADGQTCWSFFEPIEVDGIRLGEDYSFCYRWTSLLKRDLLVSLDTTVGHIGAFEYSARYIDLLAPAGKA